MNNLHLEYFNYLKESNKKLENIIEINKKIVDLVCKKLLLDISNNPALIMYVNKMENVNISSDMSLNTVHENFIKTVAEMDNKNIKKKLIEDINRLINKNKGLYPKDPSDKELIVILDDELKNITNSINEKDNDTDKKYIIETYILKKKTFITLDPFFNKIYTHLKKKENDFDKEYALYTYFLNNYQEHIKNNRLDLIDEEDIREYYSLIEKTKEDIKKKKDKL